MSEATARGEWLFYGANPPLEQPTRETAQAALERHLADHNIDPAAVRSVERAGGGMEITTDG